MYTRCLAGLVAACLLGSISILGGCSSIAPCEGQFSQLSFNPNGGPCEKVCHCNNQAYEGVCLEGSCRSRLRGSCSIQAQIRGCKLLAPAEGTTCLDGTQPCHPDGLKERRWGDCAPLKTIAKAEDSKELCLDRVDNDCDGKVDLEEDSCKEFCNRGDTRQCYTGTDGTVNVGRCGHGTQFCDAATNRWFPTCEAEVKPSTEVCNGVDDNCDGKVDEGLPNCLCRAEQKGQKEPCFTGPSGRETFGVCRAGRRECGEVEKGLFRWGKCTGQVLPKAKEECNGLDDDCNGLIDEGCPCSDNIKRSCGHDIGECRQGEQRCELGKWSRACYAQVSPRGELCDNRDNDCNGYIDDRLQRGCKTACGVGTEICTAGAWGGCTAPVSAPETCNDKDDDCDGSVDNGLARKCSNDCGEGVEQCIKGKWSACATVNPPPEICNDKDDDCDGLADEGLTKACESACGKGVQLCTKGKWSTCTPTNPPLETCDDKDNNCNGKIDEGLFRTCQAKCGNSIQVCEQGKWSECSAPKPQSEVCNGVDDNCDGTIDEGLTRACDATKCLTGTETCAKGAWTGCTSNAKAETCDNKDNDCNGQIDENLTMPCDSSKCLQGRNFCIGGAWVDAKGAPYGCVSVTAPEICNNKDDDCDGSVDNQLKRPCQRGCNAGDELCAQGQWGACSAKPADPELCDNKDNDCNGQIDENLKRACDATQCEQGLAHCVAGLWQGCVKLAPPETCNNKDDDCDGSVDENLTRSCDITKCEQGTQRCSAGTWTGACVRSPQPEVCDGLDNDCNGFTDEGLLPGCVSLLAGKDGATGNNDGLRLSARFDSSHGISLDYTDNFSVIIADTGNNRIRLIKLDASAGVQGVSTLAGAAAGFQNGTGTAGLFRAPKGVTRSSSILGTAVIADTGNHALRLLNLNSKVVTTLSGSGAAGHANLGDPTKVQFSSPLSVLFTGSEFLVPDSANHRLRTVGAYPTNTPKLGAAQDYAGTGTAGATNGVLTSATFNRPGFLFQGDGNMLVLDTGNHCIRSIDTQVRTAFGTCGTAGRKDGVGTGASFNAPTGAAGDIYSGLYIVDSGNHCIRKVVFDSAGMTYTVTTFAGICGTSGYREGPIAQALFKNPTHVDIDISKTKAIMYIADTGNHVIRRIVIP